MLSSWLSDRKAVSTFVPHAQVVVFLDMTNGTEDPTTRISRKDVKPLPARRECTQIAASRRQVLSFWLKAGNFSKAIPEAGE